MWRRTYLLLLVIRVYFALSPSYLHPDENFQGPEVFAGRIFSYPSRLPWEFTSDKPIRSVFPLWPTYDVPMNLLKGFYTESGTLNPPPELVYYVLRGVMFLLSFVLEDWAVYELVPLPRHRRATVVLVASSYVTWTYQTHTFSNSIETLLVAWGLVLIQRIVDNKRRSSIFACAVLSLIAVVGVFNRITFPAFLLIPGLRLLPHFWRKPFSLLSFAGFGLFFFCIAVLVDTTFYNPSASLWDAVHAPIITPLNNLLYNSDQSNLALHGLHPRYHHFLVNLPQLLGPAYVAIILSMSKSTAIQSWLKNIRAVSAISATAMLSIFPHQEPRFLLPCVPLLLSCLRVRKSRLFLAAWVVFNAALGFLMGVYHQGGVVPTQIAIPSIVSESIFEAGAMSANDNAQKSATILWWKTYSPPLWLLGDNTTTQLNIETRDLMGISGPEMASELEKLVPQCPNNDDSNSMENSERSIFVVAPKSATFLDRYTNPSPDDSGLTLHELWTWRKHLNLDDLDFGTDGIFPTLKRVIGRRGLSVWAARRSGCV
ncbi:Alg9-like mannosyltransferase family-domain-containing protein [Aspergillus welwitschiae]|uniref:Mannosyltransferase n=1 Tax=Aspergillus welwitschiae TaxID=1341132 RepID=A0A3F3Q878_9EURO|nr:Alg9-like mannosyltransferase family-domain-containing protein [Aspergillus welwitschiae]RDH35257.1 Alg9-like mannosyltransferase family-domain-containing protein [Aspergillus welwitschiae]